MKDASSAVPGVLLLASRVSGGSHEATSRWDLASAMLIRCWMMSASVGPLSLAIVSGLRDGRVGLFGGSCSIDRGVDLYSDSKYLVQLQVEATSS